MNRAFIFTSLLLIGLLIPADGQTVSDDQRVPAALKKFIDTTSGTSRTLGVRMISVAGGNDVFNSIQMSLVDSDFHFQFVTSNAKQGAEAILPKIREDLFSLAKETVPTK